MANFELEVEGMTCVNCAASIDKYLESLHLKDVYVNFATKEVRFTSDNDNFKIEEAVEGIKLLGFKVLGYSKPSFWTLKRKLIFAAIFTFPLLLNHLLMMVGWGIPFLERYDIQFILCLPVYVLGFWHFGKSAWSSLKIGTANMDVLIFVGSSAAFFYSLIGWYYNEPNFIFFETSATIITLVLLGNLFEEISVAKTTSAIDDLNDLKTEFATRKMKSGALLKVPLNDLVVGQIVVVNEGDTIPADGVIVKGEAEVNESFISGESVPVYKKINDAVVGASIVDSGQLEVEVLHLGKDSYLGKMIELVKSAQMNKPTIQRLADKISSIFVPVVIGISIFTFIVSYFFFDISSYNAFSRAIAVLVISCPCAMGLATPTAIMVGVGRLTKMGILVKGGQTLETLSGVSAFYFDKTGTLTDGNFEITKIDFLNNKSLEESNDLLSVCYNIEKKSSHPIAKSIVVELAKRYSLNDAINFDVIKEIKGAGLEAIDLEGNKWFVGINLNENQERKRGVALYKNDEKIFVIYIKDALREGVAETMKMLKEQGIKETVLSGDNEQNVRALSETLSIDKYLSGQSPADKLNVLKEAKVLEPIAMVGDGINDSAALALADVGVSLSSSTNIAMKSADIVLMNDNIKLLLPLLRISKLTMKTIKENLFWAFGYNVIAIPIAALGYLNPMWGALFMALSDVVVIGNSIRLNKR